MKDIKNNEKKRNRYSLLIKIVSAVILTAIVLTGANSAANAKTKPISVKSLKVSLKELHDNDIMEYKNQIMAEKKRAKAEAEKKEQIKKERIKKEKAKKEKAKRLKAKKLKKQKLQKKKKWKALGDCRVTTYCPACNDPAGSYQSSSGTHLYEGCVACSWLSNGTKLRIDGVEYTVVDTCGTDAIDIFVDSGDTCQCSMNTYKKVFIKQ